LFWRSLTVDKLGTRLARNLQVGFDIKEVVNCTEFQVRGAHLKKLRRAEGGAKIVGVFRVKNYDFTPTNLIFSNFKMKIKHRIIGEYATKRCFFDLKNLTIVTGS
jgi:hypothetical protein